MEDEDGGLFNIEVSSEDESTQKTDKVPRDFQSEEDFQSQRAEYKPNIEIGELWRKLTLPIDNPSKQQSQMILHAIEELYFFKRYREAEKVTEEALRGQLSIEFRQIVENYRRRCEAKIAELVHAKVEK